MSAQKLIALAERCEAASGPDRGLDLDIATLVKRTPFPAWTGQTRARQAKPFTASLDAAMQLVPKEHGAHIEIPGEEGAHAYASVWRDTADYDGSTKGRIARSAALALCACALRARAAMEPTI